MKNIFPLPWDEITPRKIFQIPQDRVEVTNPALLAPNEILPRQVRDIYFINNMIKRDPVLFPVEMSTSKMEDLFI